MRDRDTSAELRERIQLSYQDKTPLQIVAGQSKGFYGNPVSAEPFPVSAHRGIVHYEPTELILTARCGTPLTEIEQTLAEHNQILGFEPPYFANTATPSPPIVGHSTGCTLPPLRNSNSRGS